MGRSIRGIGAIAFAFGVGCEDPTDPVGAAERYDVEVGWSRTPYRRSAAIADANSVAVLADRVRVVHLDACGFDAPAGATFSWFARARTGDAVGERFPVRDPESDDVDGCAVSWRAPWEGDFRVEVDVEAGGQTERGRVDLTVEDIWLLSLGDSYASGEGNPDNEPLEEPIGTYTWKDARCHRSDHGWPARVASLVQARHPDALVLHTYLACSGASLQTGILGPYAGLEEASPPLPPQVEVAEDLVAATDPLGTAQWTRHLENTRRPDAILMTAGGNDIGFADIIQDVILFGPSESTFNGLPGRLDTAGDRMGQLNDRLIEGGVMPRTWDDGFWPNDDDHLTPAPQRMVFHLPYPDPTLVGPDHHDACWNNETYWTTDGQFEELSERVVDAMNEKIATNAGLHGWTYVTGHLRPFSYHGICADEPWYRVLTESFQIQDDQNGTFHPNRSGHASMGAHTAEVVSARVAGRLENRPGHTVWVYNGAGIASDGPIGPGSVLQQGDPLTVEAASGMQVALFLGDQPVAPGEPISSPAGDTVLRIERSWTGAGGRGDPIRLPDVSYDVTIAPTALDVLEGVTIEVQHLSGRSAVPLDQVFGTTEWRYAGAWLDPVSLVVTAPAGVTWTATQDWVDASAPYAGESLVAEATKAPQRTIRYAFQTPNGPAESVVVLYALDKEDDWFDAVLNGLRVEDAYDPTRAHVYEQLVPDTVPVPTGPAPEGFDAFRIVLDQGAGYAAEGFLLRRPGQPWVAMDTVFAPAESGTDVEIWACHNFLASCEPTQTGPHGMGSERVMTITLP